MLLRLGCSGSAFRQAQFYFKAGSRVAHAPNFRHAQRIYLWGVPCTESLGSISLEGRKRYCKACTCMEM